MRSLAARALLCLLLLVPAARSRGQEPDPPLPDLAGFLQEVRARLHGDEVLLARYTFLEKHTERHLDGRGAVKRTKSETFEVYPSAEPGHTYRKLVARDGRPLDAREIEKEDRKHDEKVAKADAGGDEKREARLAELRRKEAAVIDELFGLYDIRIAGREAVDGRSAIVLTYVPRPGYKPKTRGGKILKNFAGRAWIDEEDRQLVRLEGRLIDNLSFGLGVLARLQKGATASFTRRKVNGEIWLPSEARFAGSARLFLIKSLRLDATSEYSDYRKFSVGTSVEIRPERSEN
jgi:hypothetical protein